MDARELSKSECYHRQPSVNMESLLSLLQSSQQIHHHQQQQQQLQQHHTQNPNQSQPELHRWFPSPLTYAQHAQQAVRAAPHQNLAHTASHQFDQHQFPATRPQVQWNPANAYNQLQTAVQLMLQSRQCNESVARCTSQINHPNSHPSSIASRHLNTSQSSIVDEDVVLAGSKSCEKHELEEGDDANSNDQAISELLDEPAKEKSNPSQGSSCNGSRIRTAYNSMQILNLEREFGNNMYLTRIRRIELAQKLKLSEKQVKIWFQNRRVKYKKESVSHR